MSDSDMSNIFDILDCCERNRPQELKLLIQTGDVDLNEGDVFGETPLHIASQRNFPDCVKVLILGGADINVMDDEGNTPLHYAAIGNSVESLEILIDNGADINAKTYKGVTPLHAAIIYNSRKCLEKLIQLGADINAKDNSECTLLHCCVYHMGTHGNIDEERERMKFLILSGADPNIKNNEGETFLDYIHDATLRKEMEEYCSSFSTLHIKEPDHFLEK